MAPFFRTTSIPAILLGVLGYALLLSCFWLHPEKTNLIKKRNQIVIGHPNATDSITLIGYNDKILGKTVGHDIRKFLKENTGTKIIWQRQELNEIKSEKIVYAGALPLSNKSYTGKQLILLNPYKPEKITTNTTDILILWGEYYENSSYDYWDKVTKQRKNIQIIQLSGKGEYLPTWLETVKF